MYYTTGGYINFSTKNQPRDFQKETSRATKQSRKAKCKNKRNLMERPNRETRSTLRGYKMCMCVCVCGGNDYKTCTFGPPYSGTSILQSLVYSLSFPAKEQKSRQLVS